MQNTIMTGGALQFKPCKQMLLSKYRQVCGTENVTNDETTNVKARKYDKEYFTLGLTRTTLDDEERPQ